MSEPRKVPELHKSDPINPDPPEPTFDEADDPLPPIRPVEWDDPSTFWLRVRQWFDRTVHVGGKVITILADTPIPAMQNAKTTVAGLVKTLIAALTLALAGAGIDVTTASGVISLPPDTGWMLTAGAGLYMALTTVQGWLSSGRDGVSTTIIAIAKALSGAIGTVLLTRGIDVTSGTIFLSPDSAGWILALAIAYFALSATQAFFTVDWTGGFRITALTGGIKALSGMVAAIMVYVGFEFTPDGPTLESGTAGIGGMILFGVYTVLSFLQARATKDKEPALT